MDNSSTITTLSRFESADPEILEAINNPDLAAFQIIQDEYSEISEKLKALSAASGEGGCSTETLNTHLVTVNEIFHKVKRANEARIDARVLKQVSALGKANIEKTQCGFLTFKPAEYARHLKRFLSPGEDLEDLFSPGSVSLMSMAKELAPLYRSTYGIEPLYSALDWEPPEKAPRESQRRREDNQSNVISQKIERVIDSRTDEENQTEEVDRIYNCLKRVNQENGPIPFLEFVIDPKCFSTTVQNIFHTSFLIRDKRAKLTFDEFKIPYICYVTKRSSETKVGASTDSNRQSVIEMNVDIWKEAVQVLEIEKAAIPNISLMRKRNIIS